jgi:hypothetical protein
MGRGRRRRRVHLKGSLLLEGEALLLRPAHIGLSQCSADGVDVLLGADSRFRLQSGQFQGDQAEGVIEANDKSGGNKK